MDSLTISPETYASVFSQCKPGEEISGTYSGTFGEPNPDGSYTVEVSALTKDETETAAPEEVPEEGAMMGASPAAAAVMSRGGKTARKRAEMA